MQLEDKGDAFDWAWALWYWLSHWHGGQSCEKYAALSSFQVEYNLTNIPSIDFDDNDCDEYDQCVLFYHEITEDNWIKKLDTLRDFLDNKWED